MYNSIVWVGFGEERRTPIQLRGCSWHQRTRLTLNYQYQDEYRHRGAVQRAHLWHDISSEVKDAVMTTMMWRQVMRVASLRGDRPNYCSITVHSVLCTYCIPSCTIPRWSIASLALTLQCATEPTQLHLFAIYYHRDTIRLSGYIICCIVPQL